MTIYTLAEEEQVDVHEVFRFARFHFGYSTDNTADYDYECFKQGGAVPHYINDMLAYQEHTFKFS